MDTWQDTLSRWIEIDLDALRHNLVQIRGRLQENVQIMAVVKGDAYGCGSVACAETALANSCTMLGVTTVEEALELRFHGIEAPILVFSPLQPGEAAVYLQHHLTPTITEERALQALADETENQHSSIDVHFKIETGMGRLGLRQEELPRIHKILQDSPQLKIGGLYTHFAKATDSSYVKIQADKLLEARDYFRKNGEENFILHACASAGYIKYPQYHFDMVRIGTLLYGQYPAGITSDLVLKDPWKAKARVIQINNIAPGDSIGYGRDFIATRNMRIAIIPIGLADGFNLAPPSKAKGLVDLLRIIVKDILKFIAPSQKTSSLLFFKGKALSLVGRIGMQILAVDITDMPDLKLGDYVDVDLRRTSASARLARVYFKQGRAWQVRSIAQGEMQELNSVGITKETEE